MSLVQFSSAKLEYLNYKINCFIKKHIIYLSILNIWIRNVKLLMAPFHFGQGFVLIIIKIYDVE